MLKIILCSEIEECFPILSDTIEYLFVVHKLTHAKCSATATILSFSFFSCSIFGKIRFSILQYICWIVHCDTQSLSNTTCFFIYPPHRGCISFVNTCGTHRNIDLRPYVPWRHFISAKF